MKKIFRLPFWLFFIPHMAYSMDCVSLLNTLWYQLLRGMTPEEIVFLRIRKQMPTVFANSTASDIQHQPRYEAGELTNFNPDIRQAPLAIMLRPSTAGRFHHVHSEVSGLLSRKFEIAGVNVQLFVRGETNLETIIPTEAPLQSGPLRIERPRIDNKLTLYFKVHVNPHHGSQEILALVQRVLRSRLEVALDLARLTAKAYHPFDSFEGHPLENKPANLETSTAFQVELYQTQGGFTSTPLYLNGKHQTDAIDAFVGSLIDGLKLNEHSFDRVRRVIPRVRIPQLRPLKTEAIPYDIVPFVFLNRDIAPTAAKVIITSPTYSIT